MKITQAFFYNSAIGLLWSVMPEETTVSNLQDQNDRVEQIVHKTPFRLFVIGVAGGICFGASSFFGQSWAIVGAAILGGCIGFCAVSVRNAKEEFRKLLEQLNSKNY